MTEVPTSGPEKGPNHATTVSSGTLIMGTYEIERLINSGGMGEVYRGRNIHNDEPVAIKIVLQVWRMIRRSLRCSRRKAPRCRG